MLHTNIETICLHPKLRWYDDHDYSPSDIEALDVLGAEVAGGTHKHVEHVGDDEGVVQALHARCNTGTNRGIEL